MIDGCFVNGSAQLVGWSSRGVAPHPVRLHLPLRVHDDHRRLRCCSTWWVGRCQRPHRDDELPYPARLAIWVPIVAGLRVLGVGRDRDAGVARWIALLGALAGFLVTLPLYTQLRHRRTRRCSSSS